MAQYVVGCEAGGEEATLVLRDSLLGFPAWRCVEGAEVWGRPDSGTCLSPNLTGGELELSLGIVLSDWSARVGASGSGYRLNDNGGSFPATDFEWEVLSKN